MKLEHEKEFMYEWFSKVDKERFIKYVKGVAANEKYYDLNKRIRWDWFNAIPPKERNKFLVRNAGCKDSHIDTLLKFTLKRYLKANNMPGDLEMLTK